MFTAITRAELITRMTLSLPNVPPAQIDEGVRSLQEALCTALADGRRIEIRGFGSFSVRTRSARLSRNPKTGEPVEIGVRKIPYFKPGKALRVRVDQARLGD